MEPNGRFCCSAFVIVLPETGGFVKGGREAGVHAPLTDLTGSGISPADGHRIKDAQTIESAVGSAKKVVLPTIDLTTFLALSTNC